MPDIATVNGSAMRTLEFLILIVIRTTKVIGVTWEEMNFKERQWAILLLRPIRIK
jgi:hypothetical protein